MTLLGFAALEFAFISLLVTMTVVSGLLGLVVVARVVEPRGVKALLERLKPGRRPAAPAPPPMPSWRRERSGSQPS